MKIRVLFLCLLCFISIAGTIDVLNLLQYANQPIPTYSARDNTPADNAITNAGATLGRVLFYDKKLSINNTIACASCHQQEFAFSDTARLSVGFNGELTGRHSMRLSHSRFGQEDHFFWDERATSLEDQTTHPLHSSVEMGFDGTNGADIDSLIRKMEGLAYYQRLFPLAFGDPNITEERMQKAMAQFVRSIQSFDSKFDIGRVQVAADTDDFPNFTTQENLGKTLFLNTVGNGGAGCQRCHRAPDFDIDPNSDNNGIVAVAGDPMAIDTVVTRSPSLRDLVGPGGTSNGAFMHDGSLETLLDVINHYDRIPNNPANTNLDDRLKRNNGNPRPLDLTDEEKDALVAFLRTLTSSDIYTNEKWSNPFDEMDNLTVTDAPPNFVVILVDDMGWTGTSVEMDDNIPESKSGYYFTPNIDSLIAQKGMIFSQGYAPAPKCAPSRCAILTGQTTARNRFTETNSQAPTDQSLLPPSSNVSIDINDITVGEWLQSNLGYRTAHYGKWHLRSGGTADNGFDAGDGNTDNNDGDQDAALEATNPKKIFSMRDSAYSFITEAHQNGTPFYIQLSHYAVHSPSEARPETIDLYNDPNERTNNSGGDHSNDVFGAMTEDTDTSIGQVLDSLKNLGLLDNTYIIFTSDNGATSNATNNNLPLSLGKSRLTEGGVRVPFIVRGPNIPEHVYNSTPVVGYDLFPTFAALTGSSAALPADIDGVDISPLFFGNDFDRTEPLYFHSPHYSGGGKVPVSAAVEGTFKLKVDYEVGSLVLYDLANDIGETTDVAADNPEIFNRLRLKLRNHFIAGNAELPTLNGAHADWIATAQPDDADGDGLNDVWEFTQLLTHLDGPDGDPDNDGFTNLEEQTNNTDPLVAEAVFDCNTTYNLDNATVPGNRTVPAGESITSSQIHSGDTVIYTAGQSITLTPGFSIGAGTEFTARIEVCVSSALQEEKTLAESRLDYPDTEINARLEKEKLDITIFPNPTKGNFAIGGLEHIPSQEYRINLYDLSGRQYPINTSNPVNITLGDIPKGLYLVKIDTVEGEGVVKKIMVQ